MVRRAFQTAAVVAMLLALCAPAALAQANKWFNPYDKAEKAIKAGKWDEAVKQLEEALAIDKVSQAQKKVESTINVDYFPQFYLAYAYAKLNQFDKAAPYASAPRPPKPIVNDAPAVFAQIQNGPKFTAAVARAETLMGQKKWDEAIAAWNEAKSALPDEAKKKNVDGKIAEATTAKGADAKAASDRKAADDRTAADARERAAAEARDREAAAARTTALNEFNGIVTRATQALTQKNYQAAITAFNEARTKLPDEFNRQNLSGKIEEANRGLQQQQAMTDFENFVKNAETAMGQKNYADAQNAFNSAKSKLPDEFGKRGLQKRLDLAGTELGKMNAADKLKAEFDAFVTAGNNALRDKKWDDAARQFEAARAKSPADFNKNGLQAKIEEASKGKAAALNAVNTVPTPPAAAVDFDKTARDGLTSLFAGDLKAAETSLAMAHTSAKASASQKAMVHAYLGVVYATMALQSKGESRKQKEELARREYSQAGNYKFPPKYVSPAVRDLLTARGSN